jgi:hypothetical protein
MLHAENEEHILKRDLTRLDNLRHFGVPNLQTLKNMHRHMCQNDKGLG